MTTPASPSPAQPAGDDRNLVVVDAATATSFEDKLHLFWRDHRGKVYAVVGLVAAAGLGKFALDYLAAQKEKSVQSAFVAATTTDQRKAFAAAHQDHPLAGIALLNAGDDAFKAGKSADAATNYDQAAKALKTGPLAARAKLGAAVAKILAGKTAEGATELKQLADDAAQAKDQRSEAAYHLVTLAADAGNSADVQKYSDLLGRIAKDSAWFMRASALRASLPTPTPAPATDGKKADTPTDLKVNLPGGK
ncbi:MAG: hypothetical protein RLZZ15_2696 [Verrucomicrobiota bacterium]|jgi:hypothetical protein